MGVLSVALSLVFAIWTAATSSLAPLFLGVSLPLAATSTLALSVAGYVLTPLVTMGALAWDKITQRQGLQLDRNFALRPRYSTILRWLTAASFVIAIWHVLNIANVIAGS